jgi:hypothetical protein
MGVRIRRIARVRRGEQRGDAGSGCSQPRQQGDKLAAREVMAPDTAHELLDGLVAWLIH